MLIDAAPSPPLPTSSRLSSSKENELSPSASFLSAVPHFVLWEVFTYLKLSSFRSLVACSKSLTLSFSVPLLDLTFGMWACSVHDVFFRSFLGDLDHAKHYTCRECFEISRVRAATRGHCGDCNSTAAEELLYCVDCEADFCKVCHFDWCQGHGSFVCSQDYDHGWWCSGCDGYVCRSDGGDHAFCSTCVSAHLPS
jgi:hypothetical protein